jgi:hypothetical protein
MLARLLIGSPETVLGANPGAVVDDCSHMPQVQVRYEYG